jgi:hypothetical protein
LIVLLAKITKDSLYTFCKSEFVIKLIPMLKYRKYLVKDNDQFDPESFSFIIEDMKLIREQTDHVLPTFKTEIILSFLKNHSLEKEWSDTNPELTRLITSGSLPTGNIESLFDSCLTKPVFRQQMEAFFTKGFGE